MRQVGLSAWLARFLFGTGSLPCQLRGQLVHSGEVVRVQPPLVVLAAGGFLAGFALGLALGRCLWLKCFSGHFGNTFQGSIER